MDEIERRHGRAGQLTFPDGRSAPIADWRFETHKPSGARWRITGSFSTAASLPSGPTRGRIVLTLLDDAAPGARWRGAVRLTTDEPDGLVRFVAVEELIWSA